MTFEEIEYYQFRYILTSTGSVTTSIRFNHDMQGYLTARVMKLSGALTGVSVGTTSLGYTTTSSDRSEVWLDYAMTTESITQSTQITYLQKSDDGTGSIYLYNVSGAVSALIGSWSLEGTGTQTITQSITGVALTPQSASISSTFYDGDKIACTEYYPWYEKDDSYNEWDDPKFIDTPIIHYNSGDISTIQRHLLDLKNIGFDYAVTELGLGNGFYENIQQRLMTISMDDTYSFSSSYYIGMINDDGDYLVSRSINVANIMSKYESADRWMKINDKQVLWFFVADILPFEKMVSWIEEIRTVYPNRDDWCLVGDLTNPLYMEYYDIFHTYNNINQLTETVYSYNSDTLDRMEDHQGTLKKYVHYYPLLLGSGSKGYMPTAQPGYDDREIPGRDGFYFLRRNGQALSDTFNMASRLASDNMICVTSYNEWPENSNIEGSKKTCRQYGRLCTRLINNWKNS